MKTGKMNNKQQFIDGELTGQEQDLYLKKLLNVKFNKERTDKWASDLASKGVHRKSEKKTKVVYKVILFIICLALLVFFLSKMSFDKSNDTIQHYAQQYQTTDIFTNPTITKGVGDIGNLSNDAAIHFNNMEWGKSQQAYEGILVNAADDIDARFYAGVSSYYNKDYASANQHFSILLSNNNNTYIQESNWFYGLSLISEGKEDEGLKVWSKIKEGEWKYEEVNNILK